jgi:hypothetical protein
MSKILKTLRAHKQGTHRDARNFPMNTNTGASRHHSTKQSVFFFDKVDAKPKT